MSEPLYRKCPECEGSGKTGNDLCDLCVGTDSDMWGMVPVERNYEAAMKLRHQIAWAHKGYGPLVEKYGIVEIEGSRVGRVSDYDETRDIVDAALGEPA